MFFEIFDVVCLKSFKMTFIKGLAVLDPLLSYANNLFNKLFYMHYETREIFIGSGVLAHP